MQRGQFWAGVDIGSPPLCCTRIGTRMSVFRGMAPLTKRARLAAGPLGIVRTGIFPATAVPRRVAEVSVIPCRSGEGANGSSSQAASVGCGRPGSLFTIVFALRGSDASASLPYLPPAMPGAGVKGRPQGEREPERSGGSQRPLTPEEGVASRGPAQPRSLSLARLLPVAAAGWLRVIMSGSHLRP